MARACLKGIAVSPGIAIGPLRLQANSCLYDKRGLDADEIGPEIKTLDMAIQKVRHDLEEIILRIPSEMDDYREMVAAQLELARDPKIEAGIRSRIARRKICAVWAIEEVIQEISSLFSDIDDPYLSERAQDIKALGQRLANALAGAGASCPLCADCVMAAHDLSPADVFQLRLEGIRGLLTVEGGATSHAAILARGLKIPSLVGIENLFQEARPRETAIVDSINGQVLLGPEAGELEYYRHRQKIYGAFERNAAASARWPARTTDGIEIKTLANLENLSEIPTFKSSGAEGIGLYRTEFAYFSGKLPDEKTLFDEYSAVVKNAAPRPVVFRVLDVGADKILPGQEILREPNPALGLRGIRFCLQRKDVFATQLRAILRACHNANAAIMLPMVCAPFEIEETKRFIEALKNEMRKKNIPHAENLPIGAMIETPAAVLACDSLAAKCDFLSIGTNDLSHYLMAIDRNNRHVAYLHEPLHPAFTRSLKIALEAGQKRGIPVSVCGELAADPFGVALLIGLGLRILSTSPGFTPAIKHMLRKMSARQCERIANAALNEPDAAKTREELRELLQKSLGAELSFYSIFTAS